MLRAERTRFIGRKRIIITTEHMLSSIHLYAYKTLKKIHRPLQENLLFLLILPLQNLILQECDLDQLLRRYIKRVGNVEERFHGERADHIRRFNRAQVGTTDACLFCQLLLRHPAHLPQGGDRDAHLDEPVPILETDFVFAHSNAAFP